MVALDDGTYSLTDPYGRYHIPAVRPGQRLIKVNRHSMIAGARIVDSPRILWLTPGLTLRANFAVTFESEVERIGESAVHGVAVSAEDQQRPIAVEGNAEALSVFVNGREVLLDSADVRLDIQSLDGTVGLTGSRLDEPIRFDLEAERRDTINRWLLVVRDGAGREIHRFAGDGPPPPQIFWDGRLSDGKLLQGGEIYQYQLATSWIDGPGATSPRRLFGINRTSAISMELTGEAFESGSDRLSDRAQSVMAEAATLLREHPDERILIEGHTDNVGTDAAIWSCLVDGRSRRWNTWLPYTPSSGPVCLACVG